MLTTSQIDHLYTFCRKHYIHYYEVQAELVDHFADAIEAHLTSNPALSFEQALDKVYAAFGGYKGMQLVQEEKRKQIETQHRKMKREIFFSYFRWPRITVTLLGGAVAYVAEQQLNHRLTAILIPIIVAAGFIWELRWVKNFHSRMKKKKEQLLILSNPESFVSMMVLFFCFNGLVNTVGNSIAPGLFSSQRLPFYILLPLYLVCVRSYREYLDKVYHKAVELYPKAFAHTS